MELRVLQYFLAVAREQNVSRAAESLHLSQPTLSRQLRDMEEELGKQLFIRGSRRITLTDEGMILRKRAEEILDLVKKTETEIAVTDSSISGDVYIGAGETEGVHFLTNCLLYTSPLRFPLPPAAPVSLLGKRPSARFPQTPADGFRTRSAAGQTEGKQSLKLNVFFSSDLPLFCIMGRFTETPRCTPG